MRFSALIIAITLAASSARSAAADDPVARGRDAMAARLWEIAAAHFTQALATPGLADAEKTRLTLLLAEANIRNGNHAQAIALLSRPVVAKDPATDYWRGLAFAGKGEFAAAAESLGKYAAAPSAPYHAEAILSLAEVHLAHNEPDAALATLERLISTPGPVAARASLGKAGIFLDLGRIEEAAVALPEPAALSPADRAAAAFIEARLLLLKNQPQEAAATFQTLVSQPAGQSLLRHHMATVGLADSLAATDKRNEAATALLALVEEQPASPALAEIFKRLLAWLPESPSLDDPVLVKTAEWIPETTTPSTGLIPTSGGGAASAWPVPAPQGDLPAYALYLRGVGLTRIPAHAAEGAHLLNRLRLEYPGHVLAERALFQLAAHHLSTGNTARATAILESLRGGSASPIKGEAAFLEARSAFEQGDAAAAAKLFSAAAASLDGSARVAAASNAVVALIRGGLPLTAAQLPENPEAAARLELEQALALPAAAARKAALEAYLKQHPGSSEARLAAATAALAMVPPDLVVARAQLDALTATEETAGISPAALTLLRLRIADAENDSGAVIAIGRPFLKTSPAAPEAADAAYILGRHLFLTRDYNEARLVVEKLAAENPDSAHAQAAWLLAARAAALVPTSQSRQEAIVLFDKAISNNGPLGSLAKLEKARLLIDMGRLAEAAKFLRPWFDSLKPADPLHLPAGLLLAEAIYSQGASAGKSLAEALKIYDALLATAKSDQPIWNHIQYLRGLTLEQLSDLGNPAIKREREAFTAYYSVLERDTPPAEWHFFELCGFRALALLEKEKRWPAAIACAKRIASFKGPRAREAAERASQLQLKNMIWED
ncbi:MAG: tetratricopeptide repeat protein [Verrucomicrobiota bacterium]